MSQSISIPVLKHLIQIHHSKSSIKNQKASQTQISQIEGVEFKLLALEQEFKSKAQSIDSKQSHSILYEKELQEQAKNEVTKQIEHIRDVESSLIRVQEMSRAGKHIDYWKKKIQNDSKAKIDEIKSKEISATHDIELIKLNFRQAKLQLSQEYEKKILEMTKNHEIQEQSLKSKISEIENSRLELETKKIEFNRKLAELELLKETLSLKTEKNISSHKEQLTEELNEEKSKLLIQQNELKIMKDSFSRQLEEGFKAKQKVSQLESMWKSSSDQLELFKKEYEELVSKFQETQLELGVITRANSRDLQEIFLKNEEIKVLKERGGIFEEILLELREKCERWQVAHKSIVELMICQDREMAGTGYLQVLDKLKGFYREIEEESLKIKMDFIGNLEKGRWRRKAEKS